MSEPMHGSDPRDALPDDAATTIYGRLLWRHMDAARKRDEQHRAKIFDLIEAYREEFPGECKVWEDRYPGQGDTNR